MVPRPDRGMRCQAVWLLVALASPSASAHPNALQIVAHMGSLHVEEDTVELRYAVELPSHGHSHAPVKDGQTLTETLSGLQIQGGAAVEVLQTEGPTHTRTGSSVIRVVAETRRLADDIHLEDGNYPDKPGTFSTVVTVGPGLDVVSCSLFSVKDGQIKASRAGRWQLGDDHRRTSVTVRSRDSVTERLMDTLHPQPPVRSALAAVAPQGIQRVFEPTPLSWTLFLAAGALLGLGRAEPNPRSRAISLGLSGVLAVLLAWLGPAAAVGGTLASLVTLLVGLRAHPPRLVERLSTLFAALPLATLGAPGLVATAAPLLLVFGLRDSPRWTRIIPLAVGVLALVRLAVAPA